MVEKATLLDLDLIKDIPEITLLLIRFPFLDLKHYKSSYHKAIAKIQIKRHLTIQVKMGNFQVKLSYGIKTCHRKSG